MILPIGLSEQTASEILMHRVEKGVEGKKENNCEFVTLTFRREEDV